MTNIKKILGVMLVMVCASVLHAQTAPRVTGFIFGQEYVTEGQEPVFKTARLRLWLNGEWGGHLDADFQKVGNEVNQVFLSHTSSAGIVRVGRLLSASGWNTVPAHLLRTATSRKSEGNAGQFFEWGVQYERTFGKFTLMTDLGDNAGKPYRQTDFQNPVSSVRLLRKFGNESYAAVGGRLGANARYLSFDGLYNWGRFSVQNSAYYNSNESVGRKLTGTSFVEWRGISPIVALHLQADVPTRGSMIGTVGIAIGTLKSVYVVLDKEWQLQGIKKQSGFAAKIQVRCSL